jgi:hypothetical protein
MRYALRYIIALGGAAAVALVAAQEPLRTTRTIQERVTALEANVATIETRLGLESSRPSNLGTGESGVALAGRISALENSVQQLTADVRRIERLAENASREAGQAARAASAAEQAARDAALRTR